MDRGRPWMTAVDRCLANVGEHGRRGRRCSKPAGDGHQLGRRVRLVLDDHPLRRQALIRAHGSALLGRAHEVAALVLLAAPTRAGIIASDLSLPRRRGSASGGRLVLDHVPHHSLDLLIGHSLRLGTDDPERGESLNDGRRKMIHHFQSMFAIRSDWAKPRSSRTSASIWSATVAWSASTSHAV
jgi:hypothetical protein